MSFTSVTLTGTVHLQPGVPAVSASVELLLSSEISDGTIVVEPLANTVYDGQRRHRFLNCRPGKR